MVLRILHHYQRNRSLLQRFQQHCQLDIQSFNQYGFISQMQQLQSSQWILRSLEKCQRYSHSQHIRPQTAT